MTVGQRQSILREILERLWRNFGDRLENNTLTSQESIFELLTSTILFHCIDQISINF